MLPVVLVLEAVVSQQVSCRDLGFCVARGHGLVSESKCKSLCYKQTIARSCASGLDLGTAKEELDKLYAVMPKRGRMDRFQAESRRRVGQSCGSTASSRA